LNSKTPGAIRVVDIQSANEKIILEKNIPIIDLDECSSESNPDGFKKLSEEIGRACRDWGFSKLLIMEYQMLHWTKHGWLPKTSFVCENLKNES
tara:strand:- start:77 stop:358 length:282 start_codon:yes stop_codon:yes gene_type:complete